ncbi:MAG: hypothetical protein ACRDUB_20455, partial [Mycobacterium sp.]
MRSKSNRLTVSIVATVALCTPGLALSATAEAQPMVKSSPGVPCVGMVQQAAATPPSGGQAMTGLAAPFTGAGTPPVVIPPAGAANGVAGAVPIAGAGGGGAPVAGAVGGGAPVAGAAGGG